MTVGQCSAPVRTLTTVCLALALWATPARAQLLGGLSEQEEVELGRAAVEEMEKELDLLTDATVTTYVSELGLSLAQHSQRSQLTYVFKVVDSREINAFALPGGFIYVNRGLIETAETETELAGVLGHEIGHVVARHGAEQAQRASIANLGLRVLGSIFGSGTGGQIGGMAAELVTAGTFMRFSRDAEREADQLGAENVAAAGHDPHGMVTFFEKLAALRDGQANAVERFFASHPSPEERVSNVQGLVRSLTAGRELTKDTARFRDIKSRLENLPPPPEPEAEPGAKAGAVPTADAGGSSSDVIDARYDGDDRDHAIAARLAPVFRQALGSSARYDYITRVDFDGDWRGDNNWNNAERYPLPATVYYSVSETETHYFVHYMRPSIPATTRAATCAGSCCRRSSAKGPSGMGTTTRRDCRNRQYSLTKTTWRGRWLSRRSLAAICTGRVWSMSRRSRTTSSFDMHLQVLCPAARTARSCSTTSIQFCISSPRGMGSKPTVRG